MTMDELKAAAASPAVKIVERDIEKVMEGSCGESDLGIV
jgi:hypothetical protein